MKLSTVLVPIAWLPWSVAYKVVFDGLCSSDWQEILRNFFEDAAELAVFASDQWAASIQDPLVPQIFGSLTRLQFCTVGLAYNAATDIANERDRDGTVIQVECPEKACANPYAVFRIDSLALEEVPLTVCPNFKKEWKDGYYRGRWDPSRPEWREEACSASPDELAFRFDATALFHETMHMRYIKSQTDYLTKSQCGERTNVAPEDYGYGAGYSGDEKKPSGQKQLTQLGDTQFSVNNADNYAYFAHLLYRRTKCGWKHPSSLQPKETTADFPAFFLRCTIPSSKPKDALYGGCTTCPPNTIPTMDTIPSTTVGSLLDVLYCRLPDESEGCGPLNDLKHIVVKQKGEDRIRAGCFPKVKPVIDGEFHESQQILWEDL